MNTRIQELAVAAGGHEVAPYDYLFRQKEMEKFAELIVRECADVVKYYHSRNEPFTSRQILQHFGVEE